ncbi:MAG: hypothetical protein NC300_05315 [Bacteroidales bacterium]|nr:hypothetical protein [Clostridium sp.]MCM1203543.1 hypothetical protein [Bacteroidales bacterium]
MSEFSVDCSKLNIVNGDMEKIVKDILIIEDEINNIYSNLSISGSGTQELRKSFSTAIKELETEEKEINYLRKTLDDIINLYAAAEDLVINQKIVQSTITDVGGNGESSSEDTSTDWEKAIDILNNLSMMTSLDGLTLTIVEYLIKLVNLEADTGLFSAMGKAATVLGLVTGIVADIINGCENNLPPTEVVSDIITDVMIAGVGVAGNMIGKAVGTAIGGPVGTVVGNFVGGVIGNGASIILNLDFDGDGNTGKDNISDWICDCLEDFGMVESQMVIA